MISLLQRIRPQGKPPAKMEIRAFRSSQVSRRRAPFFKAGFRNAV